MNKPMKNRREFLATVGTAGAASIVAGSAGAVASLAADGKEKLAIDGLLDEAISSRGFKRLFTAERLKAYRDSLQELKGNKQVCETTVGMFQTLLLADRGDMDHILDAIRGIHAHSAALAKLA